MLLAARTKTVLPVSCVESLRWSSGISDEFAVSPHTAFTHLRMMNRSEVAETLRKGMGRQVAQGRVWSDVEALHAAAGAVSPTRAMRHSYEKSGPSLAEQIGELGDPEPDQTGVVACLGGSPVALDAFDRPATLRKMWPRLLQGFAMGALVSSAGVSQSEVGVDSIEAFVRSAGQTKATAHAGVGLGMNVVMTGKDVVADALVWEEGIAHASAFAVPEAPAHPSQVSQIAWLPRMQARMRRRPE